MKKKIASLLSEIESAIYLKMTPELLRYFTERSVKSGETRRLPFVEKDGLRWYDREELDSYNSYLREPWPKKPDAQRPHLPKKIKDDIMLEAAARCPVCGFDASGEAAHIEPVAETMSHHPGGLIWLCPNHHTVLDKIAVVHNVKKSTVKALKEILVDRRLRQFNIERAASSKFLQLLRQVESLSVLISDKAMTEAKKGLKAIAKIDFAALGETAEKLVADQPKQKAGKKPAPLQVLASSVAVSAKNVGKAKPGAFKQFAKEAAAAKASYFLETGQVDCPLCSGRGVRNGQDCPACGGEGALDSEAANQLDLADFEDVDCPLCKGSGQFKGSDCPECAGEGMFERRYLEQVELRDYDEVACPVCSGSGRRFGEDCPECQGDRRMERRFAAHIDIGDYDEVDCPLCEDRGQNIDCKVCQGTFKLERRHLNSFSLADYSLVDCKLCGGSGQFQHGDCPVCGGEGQMERQEYDRVEWRDWDLVKCPSCKGSGNGEFGECSTCGGEREIYRQHS
ncbi:zinc finger domain-containing protein [Rhizobium laguerreae]|uniref:zinc finger domain-containing protein n=1 Tax=Rhizobium laguerreae TaxID=1076926 RepID=UPI001C924EBE|nr:zinc finger domain-containing protein [Rhizobium laguerreae]MBY3124552.1 hypothetical protein [Rhizobium laguerreae]